MPPPPARLSTALFALFFIIAGTASAQTMTGVRIEPTPLVARSDAVTALDFEDGRIPEPAKASYGLSPESGNEVNLGVFGWTVDRTCGANGTKCSLRLDVSQGPFYFYLLTLDLRRTLGAAQGANRMSFWIKVPKGFGVEEANRFQNLNVGTYLRDPRSRKNEPETQNNHHYFQLYLDSAGDWLHVVVGESPHHQRGIREVDPAKTSWRPEITRFYDALTRFYVCSHPSDRRGYTPVRGPYRVFFDELTFFFEDERVTAWPEYSLRRGRPGALVVHPIRVTNTHPSLRRRFSYEVTSREDPPFARPALVRDLDRNGRLDPGEEEAIAAASPLLGPGESDDVLLVERIPEGVAGLGARRHRTSVLAWQSEPAVAPVDPRVQNRSIFAGRGDGTTPSCGTLCVTEAGEPPAADEPAPQRIRDLAAAPRTPASATLSWRAVPAFAYDVRMSTRDVASEADFARAMPVPYIPAPGTPGERETMTLSALRSDLAYTVAIEAIGPLGRRSPPATVKVSALAAAPR